MNLSQTDYNTSTDQEAFILSMVNEVRGMTFNFARNHALDFDDLLQEAALTIIETLHHIPAKIEPDGYRRYLQGCVKHHLQSLVYNRPTVHACSMDAPLKKGTRTLAEIIPVQVAPPEDHHHIDRRAHELYTALRRLHLEEQMYLKRVHDLNAFYPLPADWTRKPEYDRSDKTVSSTAYRKLRNDTQLAAVL